MTTDYTPNVNLYKWKTTDTKQTTITETASNADKIDVKLNDHTAQLASITTDLLREVHWITKYGADPTGVSDSTVAIQNAVNDAITVQGVVVIPQGNYLITGAINVNGYVVIMGMGATQSYITNNGTEDAFVLGTIYGIEMKDLTIIGNANSKSGIVSGSSYSRIENIHSLSNGEHGIKILPNTWTVSVTRCQTNNNKKNGLYAVASGGDGQINALTISELMSNSNGDHGIYVTGTSVTIKNCDIESNGKNGIFVSTNTFSVFGINIKDNYIESNPHGNIGFDLYPSKSFYLYNATIQGNFLNLYADVVALGKSNIFTTTDTTGNGLVSLDIDKTNMFLTDAVTHVDLADSVPTNSASRSFVNIETGIVGNTSDASAYYKNLGGASLSTYQKTNVITGWNFAKGIAYSSMDKSDNIISTINTDQAWFPTFLKQGNQFKKAGVYITTDATDYTVSMYLEKVNGLTGGAPSVVAVQTLSSNNGNKYIEMSDIQALVDIKSAKVGVNESYVLALVFSNTGGTGTNFQVGNPIITYYG